jgi:aubergine-like protein
LVYSLKTNRKQVGGETVEVEEKVYLVPELLKPTGLTDELRKAKSAMKAIAKFTQLTPSFRNERMNNLIANINNSIGVKSKKDQHGEMINELSLKIDSTSNKIKGNLSKPMRPDKGNFTIRSAIYDKGVKLNQLLIICNEQDQDYASKFAHKLKDSSKDLGITVTNPKIIGIKPDKSRGGSNVIDKDIIKVIASFPTAKMVLVFLPKTNADRVYKRVKAYCNQEAGIASQFFTCWSSNDTENINNLSVVSKVLMQMCAKLRAKLWKVDTPKDINVNGHQTMIVGADVFHKNMHQSVTSVVSTYDRDFCSYYSQTSVQKRKGDDTLYDIADKVKQAARRYVKENKAPPNIIIVYRDGVGQGQVDRVREVELKSLIKGLQSEFNGHHVKLAYIIVTKRLSDRFFTKSGNYINNPAGGLIVDTDVVKDNTFEYFMVAQAVNKGTATPTNYNVIFNTTDLKADTFYELTYNQCYSYYNWSGPLKVPAVIMMANKVADLVGQTHSRDSKDTVESLKDSLFFL